MCRFETYRPGCIRSPRGSVLLIRKRQRRGASSLDYALTMGVALPLVAILYLAGPKMMNLVNQMTTVLVSWPFM